MLSWIHFHQFLRWVVGEQLSASLFKYIKENVALFSFQMNWLDHFQYSCRTFSEVRQVKYFCLPEAILFPILFSWCHYHVINIDNISHFSSTYILKEKIVSYNNIAGFWEWDLKWSLLVHSSSGQHSAPMSPIWFGKQTSNQGRHVLLFTYLLTKCLNCLFWWLHISFYKWSSWVQSKTLGSKSNCMLFFLKINFTF